MIASEQLVVGLYDRGEGTPNKILDIGNPRKLKNGIWSHYLVNFRPVLSFDASSDMSVQGQEIVREDLFLAYSNALIQAEDTRYGDTDVVVGFDRQQGGREQLEAAGMNLTAAIVAIDAFAALAENQRITQTEFDFLREYTLGPKMLEEPADHPWKVK